jgi:alpha-1,2-mannosyltransferase
VWLPGNERLGRKPLLIPYRRLVGGWFAGSAGALVLFASTLLFIHVMVRTASQGAAYDLAPVFVGGRLAATSQLQHLYAHDPDAYNRVNDPDFIEASSTVGFPQPTPFVYPPLVAAAVQGWARPGMARSIARAWNAVSVFLVFWCVFATLTIYLPRQREPLVYAAILVALCRYEPLRYGFWLSQTTILILALILAALMLVRRRHDHSAGLLLAVAAFIKITPAVFALAWLWRGPRRAAAYFVAWTLLLWSTSIAVCGIDANAAYIERVRSIGRSVVIAYNNQSVLALLSRIGTDRAQWFDWQVHAPSILASAATLLVSVGVVVAALAVVRRIPRAAEGEWRPLTEAFAFALMLLVPNIAWTHYFVFLLPAIAAAFSCWSGSRSALWALAAGVLVPCSSLILARQDPLPVNANVLRLFAPTISLAVLVATLFLAAHRGEHARRTEQPCS